MDFLGLATLTVLSETVKLVAANRGVQIDLGTLPLDDSATYQLFARGDTAAIFQFESHGMRDILRRYQPTRLEDLTALNALYRPGPIQGGMVDDFINRKHGRKQVTYDLPELREILEETYGVILYQEQVMQIANRLAGFSLGEADILRRAIGKKNREEMAAQREQFLSGCAAHNVTAKKAERIFDLITEFAGYGFNKSHSCAYALLAYQTAYLKTHYPVEYMAAVLTCEREDPKKLALYFNECREIGIQMLAPDVNCSELGFQPELHCIRFGLGSIKNVGESAARSILDARQRQGHFSSLEQLCHHNHLNKSALESLIKSGSLDTLGWTRAQMMAGLATRPRDSQISLKHRKPWARQAIPDWPQAERLVGEKEVLGFYVTGHPLEKLRPQIAKVTTTTSVSLHELSNNSPVTLAGLLTQFKVGLSRKGNVWAKGVLEDLYGSADLLVFGDAVQQFQKISNLNTPVVVRGTIRQENGQSVKVVAKEVRELKG